MFIRFAALSCLLVPATLSAQGAPLQLALVQRETDQPAPDIRLVTPRAGYLLLLHVTGGKARVMFPGKPTSSSELAAGAYNLEQLGARVPAYFEGGGSIVAAWSEIPIRTGDFVRFGHWAVGDLRRADFTRDPEGATTALARRLGATSQLLTVSVEYEGVRSEVAPNNLAAGQYRDNPDDLPLRVLRNLIQIQGNCPSGTRDLTGAREFCSSPEPLPISRPRRPTPTPESGGPQDRPVYSPPPPSAPAPSISSRPPERAAPRGTGTHRKPL